MSVKNKRKPPAREASHGFVTEFTHYRTGKKMRAVDYGYKAWPFGPTSKRN